MREHVRPGSGISAAVLAAILGLSVSVSGQGVSGGGTNQAGTADRTMKRLSVDDAVAMALEQNLNLQVERVNPRVQAMNMLAARAAWTPEVTSSFGSGSTNQPNGNIFSGTTSTQTNDAMRFTLGANQDLPWGGSYDVSWSNARTKSNILGNFANPALTANLSASYTQPLVRNFRIDGAREQFLITQKNREMSDVQLRQAVVNTVRSVKNAYWDLSYAVSSLEVQRQTLDLARESLRNNEARVKIGTMAPIDIIQAQAEVASREEGVISAEAAVARAEDRLRGLIMDPQAAGFWTMGFELTDSPTFQATDVNVDAAVQEALSKRTDLVTERKSLEINDVTLRYMRNQILPDVNLRAQYGLSAQGGTLYSYDYSDVFNPVVIGKSQIGYSSVLRSLLRNDFPAWSFSVTFGYPIGTSAAEANLARAKLQYTQAQTQLRAAELNVATQVRDAARQVNANRKRVESTRASRELQEKKLEAEQKKFAAGLQTTFFVLQAQRDLSQARNAELQAILDYTRSLVDFQTVQEAPIGGGGGSLVIQP